MAGTAQSAVDSLLGRLSSVLLEEAQLLRGVRGDVEFIKDEMESMNGFLLDVAAAERPNHQVRAWDKQVKELAYDSQNCIDGYVQCLADTPGAGGAGVLATLRRAPLLLRTMPARHRIAMRIRELKARARDLGERPRGGSGGTRRRTEASSSERHRLLERRRPGGDRLADQAATPWPSATALRVIAIVRRQYQEDEYPLARKLYEHPSVSSSFNLKAWINGVEKYTPRKATLQCILEQLPPLAGDHSEKPEPEGVPMGGDMDEEEKLVKKLKDHLKGKRFLIVAANDPDGSIRTEIESAACHFSADGNGDSLSAGSAIIVTTWIPPRASVPYKVKNYLHIDTLFHEKAVALVGDRCDGDLQEIIRKILMKRGGNFFSMEMFLRALYVNPNRTREEPQHLLDNLTFGSIIATHMIQFCYNDLPSHYKSCLLYLSILFERMSLQSSSPQDFRVKRTSIVRRWAAENLITKRDGLVATDEAERCFNALVVLGLVCPVDIGAAGKVKSCTVHHRVLSFITKMARDEGLVDTDLPPDLACRLSIRNGIRLQHLQLLKKKKKIKNVKGAQQSTTCWNTRKPPIPADSEDSKCSADMDYTEVFLESLPTFSPLGLVEVLDLEGFKGLKKHHIQDICDKVFQLKYLSIRNTGVTELPKDIEKLRYLETLDIRQTKIRTLTAKAIVLPKLMHLLAGHIEDQQTKDDSIRSGRSFSTVHMPRGIGSMTDLQILCHVEVSNSADELMDVGRLQQLRKLGVVLRGKEARLGHFLRVIERLNECLCSLSVRIELTDSSETPDLNMVKTAFSPPKSLESLSINGNITGLPNWIKELRQLVKITLCGTSLMDNAIRILGELVNLRCLRLWHKSYIEMRLALKDEEFQNLKYLIVEVSDITTIHFGNGAAPKLEKIVWAFTEMVSLSGLKGLPALKEIELNGDCKPYPIIQDMAAHPNHPVVIHNAIREALK
uniref:disease resistance protein PIK6-NP-like n=1 Tax=Phragmites australis TaxID=29695 RepID=UPI002D765734|nr:disease resistance protein PIK6-NP-like [Phragmites australis]